MQQLIADWQQSIDGNCEQHIWQNAEWISAITATFITFIGVYGELQSQYITPFWKIMWWMFIMNGIGSMMFHATMQTGWDLIDSMTMIIAVILGSYKAVHMICLDKYFILSNILNKQNYYLYNILSSINNIIHLGALLVFLASDALTDTLSISSIAMIPFSLSIIIQYTVGIKYLYNDQYSNSQQFKTTTKYFLHSIILTFIALLIRFSAEFGCHHHNIFLYSFGHAIWHIISALGLYKLAISLMYIDALNRECGPYWSNTKLYHIFCPVLCVKSFRYITILPRKFRCDDQMETKIETASPSHALQFVEIIKETAGFKSNPEITKNVNIAVELSHINTNTKILEPVYNESVPEQTRSLSTHRRSQSTTDLSDYVPFRLWNKGNRQKSQSLYLLASPHNNRLIKTDKCTKSLWIDRKHLVKENFAEIAQFNAAVEDLHHENYISNLSTVAVNTRREEDCKEQRGDAGASESTPQISIIDIMMKDPDNASWIDRMKNKC